jgi:hypothetical protein
MEDEQKPTSGAEGSEGRADTSENKESENKKTEPDKTPDVVSRKAYTSVSDDMHRFKREAAEAKQKLADLEAKKLADDKNYQELYEREKKARLEADEQNQKKDKYYIHTQKSSEIRKLAMEIGLRSEALDDLDLLDYDGVEVEVTSTGRYNVLGGKQFVENLKNKKPHWFNKDKPPKVNAGGGGVTSPGTGKLTPTDVVNAERQMKRGKMSKEDFHVVFNKYVEQKKQKTS